MHRRSLTFAYIRWRPGKKKDLGKLDACYGASLVDHFRAFSKRLEKYPIVDEKTGRFVKVVRIQATGESVLLDVEVGRFGEPGSTWNVRKNVISHDRTVDDAATMRSRLLFFVAPSSKVGVFGIESVAGASGGSHIIDAFKSALGRRWADDFWPMERVYEKEDWVALASLKQLTAVYYKWNRNIANGLDAERLYGRMERSLFPESDGGSLPKELWDAVRENKLKASTVIGFEVPEFENRTSSTGEVVGPKLPPEPDEWIAHVERDGRTKMVELGVASGIPTIRVVISDTGVEPLTDPEFINRSASEVKESYETVTGTQLKMSVFSGNWSGERASLTWEEN